MPLQFVAVSVACSLPHSKVLLAVMAGVVGAGPVVMVTELDATLVPQVVVQVAV